MNDSAADFLIRPVQSMLDRGVRYSTTAAALCERLEGRVLQIQPGPDGWAAYFIVQDGRLLLKSGVADVADATMSGSLINLARLGAGDPEAVIRSGDVTISGDADVATEFRALLDFVRPDWEEELSRVLGDPVAHEIGRAVRGLGGWAAKFRGSMGRNIAEYLTEESRDLAASTELDEFCAEVDEVAMGVERFEAKLHAHRRRLSEPGKAAG
jgi:ubiquinone biosynthesis protein UbiJ